MANIATHPNSPPISRTDPATHAAAVTPSDSTDLTFATRSLYLAGAGDLKVNMVGGETGVTFLNCAMGYHPLAVTRIWQTGTTATSIVALW